MNIKEMSKEERERAVLKGLVFLVVVISLYLFGFRPLMRQIHEHEKELAELNEKIQKADQLSQRSAQVREEADRVRKALQERFNQHLPPPENPLLWATQMVYRHATERDIEIRVITESAFSVPFWVRSDPSSSEKSTSRSSSAWRSFAPYTVDITVEAPFPDILMLMAGLERKQPLLNVSRLSLQSDPRAPGIQVADLSLQWPRLAVPVGPRIAAFMEKTIPVEEAP